MTHPRKRPPGGGDGDGDAEAAPPEAGAFTLDDYLDHLIAESNLRDALEGRLRPRARTPRRSAGGTGGAGEREDP